MGKAQCNISVDHPDADVGFALIAEAIGGQSHEFTVGILEGLGGIASDGNTVSLQRLNFALSIVRGLEAKDQTEALLGAQMAAIHIATMKTAEVFMRTTDLQGHKSIESSLNKLARTFAAQVEALKRYRSKGEQRVYVERVNVERGGQAIVGNVSHGGGGDGEENGAITPWTRRARPRAVMPIASERACRVEHRLSAAGRSVAFMALVAARQEGRRMGTIGMATTPARLSLAVARCGC